MAKGYWIAHVKVEDAERYKLYVEGAKPAFERFGAKFLARGGPFEQVEGASLGARHVIIEFDSPETARACYNSPEYQAALKHRKAAASFGAIVLVEGA